MSTVTRKVHTFDMKLPEQLKASPESVSKMSRQQREDRVHDLLSLSERLISQAAEIATTHGGDRELVSVAALFSGGNDSTAAAYACRPHLSHLVHADTRTGLAQTRAFVESTAAGLNIPLLVPISPEKDSYWAWVRQYGFPGPGKHQQMFHRLKEHAWQIARKELVKDGRNQRMVFVAGRRRSESVRRANTPELTRCDSIVYVSPMVLWTKLDLSTYRRMAGVPVNPVYDLLHMSGECNCGCYAQVGEREWLFRWFPDDPAVKKLLEVEEELAGRDDIPPERRVWGCGGSDRSCPAEICNE